MEQKWKWDEIIGYVFFACSLAMLAISVSLCFSTDIWYDELFTLGFARLSQGNLVSMTARDVHPPLYYLIVKLFLTGTTSAQYARQIIIAKLVSCIPYLILFLYSIIVIRKHFGVLTAGLFSFCLFAMPQLSDYTVEIRMYGYCVMLITIAAVTAYELTEKESLLLWVILTLMAICACYTHYFAAAAAVMVYLYLFAELCRRKHWKRMLRAYLPSGLICAIAFSPWIFLAALKQTAQVKENYWIQQVSFRTLLGCIRFLFASAYVNGIWKWLLAGLLFLAFLISVVFAIFSWSGKTKEAKDQSFFAFGCIGILAGIVLFGMCISLLMRPIFVYRYMLPGMGVFWLAFAILFTACIQQKKERSGRLNRQKRLLLTLLVIVAVGITNFRAFYGDEMWKNVQMTKTKKALAKIGEEDILLFNFGQLQGVTAMYLPNESYLWYESTEELIGEMFPNARTLVEQEFSDEAGIQKIEELQTQNRTIWFLGSGNAREEIAEKWQEADIQLQEQGDFLLERYWFRLYKID